MARDRIDSPVTIPPPKDSLPGSTIGHRYRVERPLGKGGMGVVYAGVHEELQRPVAIKVLMPMWSTQQEAVDRFFREARTASSVGHPNIVDVYDLGRLPDDRPYLVMPLLDGVNLADFLDEHGPQSEARVVELLSGVASALDLMHTKGLVHRDIKPENMMLVRREDGEESVKLLDFGLAALMHSSSRMTQQGSIFGTPHYMSPEAATGEMPDARGDIYSLATVAFELLTGELPFDAEHPMRVLTQKLSKDAMLLGDVSNRKFSSKVEKVIARSLALEPEERHATCREFINALRDACPASGMRKASGTERMSLAPGAGPSAPPKAPSESVPTALEPTDRPSDERRPPILRRSRLPLWMALLGLGVVGAIAWAVRPDSTPDEIVADAGTETPADPVEPVQEEAPTPPEQPPENEVVEAGDDAEQPATPHAGATMRATQRSNDSVQREETSGMSTNSSAMTSAMSSEMAVPEVVPMVESPAAVPPPDPERAAQLTREGTSAFAQGRLPAAVGLFREATQVAPSYAPAWRGLGLANERFGRNSEALRAYRRYLQLAPGAGDAAAIRARITALDP